MNNKPIAVMGLGPSGLFTVRQLHNITENIYAIGRSDDVGMYSKYIKKEKRYYAQGEESVYSALKEISLIEKQKPILYLCSDQYLTLLSNSNLPWDDVCEFSEAEFSTLKKINNKEEINHYCKENGFLIPQTVDMTTFCKQDNKVFPVIIKWKEKALESKPNPVGKVRVCKTDEEFYELLKQIETSFVTSDMLLVQTFIEGNNDYQYSVGGFYQSGHPLAHVTVKQAKQYPQGISAQVYTVDDTISEKTEKIAFELAKQFCFSGFLETEFKIDRDTGDIYLLDVNPRPWGWVSILGIAYPDFSRVLIGERPTKERQNAIWTSPIRKALSFINHNNVALCKEASHYKKAFDIYDKQDRVPGFMIYLMGIKKRFKR